MRLTIIPKQKIVQEIKSNLQSSKAVIFWNFRYVDNEKIFALKKELKKVGGFFKVYKINQIKMNMIFYYNILVTNCWNR